ncbi:MAG TPA: ThuA domain-containing protein [Armatimonadota bacterium]|jgi:hypothetical protein
MSFRKHLAAWFALAALLATLPAGTVHAKTLKHLLVVTHTAGFRHDSIPTAEKVLQDLGRTTGLWDVEYARNGDEVTQAFTASNLARFDAVVFANTTGELPITGEGKEAFTHWLEGGKGFAAMHSATDTLYQWPWYGKMIGGYFDGHPWHQLVACVVEDRKHPATKMLPPTFQITDEIYQFKDWSRNDKRVLVSIDGGSIDVSKGKREDKDYGVTWAKMMGKGRVFYTSLGHRIEVWNDPRYQDHITGGLKWVLGLAKGSTKPNPKG